MQTRTTSIAMPVGMPRRHSFAAEITRLRKRLFSSSALWGRHAHRCSAYAPGALGRALCPDLAWLSSGHIAA
jgi:hypothetical protein